MPHIVVDDIQARIFSESAGSIEIRDRSGKHLGYVAHDFTDDDIAIAKKRMASAEPRYTRAKCLTILNRWSRDDSQHSHLGGKRVLSRFIRRSVAEALPW
jgi:hypothetical protein